MCWLGGLLNTSGLEMTQGDADLAQQSLHEKVDNTEFFHDKRSTVRSGTRLKRIAT